MQEYYASTGTISVEPIDTRFYLMRHAVRYEQYNQYIYDISHKQLQEMQFTGDIDLTYTSTGITITITELDNTQKHIYYNPDFTPYLP